MFNLNLGNTNLKLALGNQYGYAYSCLFSVSIKLISNCDKFGKGFNLFCLCTIISMIHGFWIFFLLFPSNKYMNTVTPDRTTHLVFLMVSNENSELLQIPKGIYCDTPEDQSESLTIFKHFNCHLKIRALTHYVPEPLFSPDFDKICRAAYLWYKWNSTFFLSFFLSFFVYFFYF